MGHTNVPKDDELARIVADGSDERRRRRRLLLLAVGVLVVVAVAVVPIVRSATGPAALQLRTAEVTRGDLVVTVSATGTLQPTNQVDVGSEVSGLVESVFVDDNDRVEAGQVLARLDVSKLEDQVVNARAALASTKAKVQQAAASVKESRANLARLSRLFESPGESIISEADLEAAEATETRATADQSVAKAAVEQARAALSSAEIDLDKASIRSPIDGIVLARDVEPGQTVAASFTAPVLFTLAEDLSQMELQVDVDEADVGQVREGQTATFTVDAYSNRRYPATIRRVSYGSQTTDGVVSYKTVLAVNNDDLSLRPGMTATAEITTSERADVLLVPNAALRFTPAEEQGSVESGGSLVSSLIPDLPARTRSRPRPPATGTAHHRFGSPATGSSQLCR